MARPDIARIANETRVIAVVGLSPKPDRPSHGVARFLQRMGYRVIPVNPGHAGETILGEPTYASLSEIPESEAVDMVDIFRRSAETPIYRIEKRPKLRAAQGQYAVIGMDGRILKRGHDLRAVLRVFDAKMIRAV